MNNSRSNGNSKKKVLEKVDKTNSEDLDDKILNKFREVLHSMSVNGNLYPKLKPNLSEDWVKSLQNY